MITGLFRMPFTCIANCMVRIDSEVCDAAGDTQPSMTVLPDPPKLDVSASVREETERRREAQRAAERAAERQRDGRRLLGRRAAQRLGFSYEGTFRQATVVKGRNRDTAWFSVIDSEWPALKARFERWLDPSNFDASGAQIAALATL